MISKTWDGQDLDKTDHISVTLQSTEDQNFVILNVTSKWYDQWQEPFGEKGQAVKDLWKNEGKAKLEMECLGFHCIVKITN